MIDDTGRDGKGFRLSGGAWLQRIISGKRFDPGSNWRARKVGKT
jgi:hypothetical protein